MSFNSSAATWTASTSVTSNLDTRLRHRSISWPVRGSEAGLGSLSQGPDAEALAAVDVFAVQVPVSFHGERQPQCVEVQPSAVRGAGRDHCDARDELHIHLRHPPAVIRLPAIVAACFRHCRGRVRAAVCQNARLLLPAQAGEGSLPDHVPTTSDSSAPNYLFRR